MEKPQTVWGSMAAARHAMHCSRFGVEVAGMAALALGLRAMIAVGSFSGESASCRAGVQPGK